MENNFRLTGDEARILMAAMIQSEARLPIGESLMLYMRLSEISNVQPPTPEKI